MNMLFDMLVIVVGVWFIVSVGYWLVIMDCYGGVRVFGVF